MTKDVKRKRENEASEDEGKNNAGKARATVRRFAIMHTQSSELSDSNEVIAAMHAMRRCILNGHKEWSESVNWDQAYRSYCERIASWVTIGKATVHVVMIRSIRKLQEALYTEDDVDLSGGRVIAAVALSEASSETISVMKEEASHSKLFLKSALAGMRAVLKRRALKNVSEFRGVRKVLCLLSKQASQRKEMKKIITSIWLAFLSAVPPNACNETELSLALTDCARIVLPIAKNPIRFADVYVDTLEKYAASSPELALAALEGLFPLVAGYGLDFPDLYDYMLILVKNHGFCSALTEQSTHFLPFLRQALANSLATSSIRITFAQALTTAATLAPPPALISILHLLSFIFTLCPDTVISKLHVALRPKLIQLQSHYLPAITSAATALIQQLQGGDLLDSDPQFSPAAFTYPLLYAAQPKLPAASSRFAWDEEEDILDETHDAHESSSVARGSRPNRLLTPLFSTSTSSDSQTLKEEAPSSLSARDIGQQVATACFSLAPSSSS